MAKNRSVDAHTIRSKVFTSTEELSQSVEKLRGRIVQVEELKKDGLPYRDALKVTTEFQIRDTIREIFGQHSPEFHEHQHLRIKVSSKASVDETVSLLQHLILTLEEKRMEFLGLRPRPAQPAHHGNGHTASPPPIAPPAAPRVLTPPAPPMKLSAQATEEPMATSPSPVATPRPPAKPPKETPRIMEADSPGEPSSSSTATRDASPVHNAVDAPMPMTTAPAAAAPPARAATIAKIATIHRADSPEAAPPAPRMQDASSHATDASGAASPLDRIRNICTRFHGVARQLRQRRDDRPTLEVEDESDVLEVLHALLCVDFNDISTESWTPPYAGGASRTDLILKDAGIVIVAKKTRQGLGAKTLTEQMNVDVQQYAGHPHCTHLVCFLYDPEGRIGNPSGLETALRRDRNGRRVEVFIFPQ
jgi:hypothetical protein